MKLRIFQRFLTDDYKNAPDWFFQFLSVLNIIVDSLNALLANNININDNIQAERQTVTLSHNTPITVKLNVLTVQPFMVRVGYAQGYIGTAAITGYNSNGTVQVTVFFQGTPPTTAVTTMLVFEP